MALGVEAPLSRHLYIKGMGMFWIACKVELGVIQGFWIRPFLVWLWLRYIGNQMSRIKQSNITEWSVDGVVGDALKHLETAIPVKVAGF